MDKPVSKQGLVTEINEAVILVNKVKTELLHYYSNMSNNPVYKTNCKVDHDRLSKAMTKLMSVSENLPTLK